MPTRRMDMRQVRELMRLHREAGLGVRETARRAGIAESTMRDMVKRFDRAGLTWPLVTDLGNAELEVKLYGAAGVKPGRRRLPAPDWASVHRELKRKHVTLQTIRLGMKLYLVTMVRKSELQDAVRDEVDFENAVWTIPKERMKRSKPHSVYLCRQTLDIMIALKTCAGNSRYLLPSRYDADAPMSRATFNRVT